MRKNAFCTLFVMHHFYFFFSRFHPFVRNSFFNCLVLRLFFFFFFFFFLSSLSNAESMRCQRLSRKTVDGTLIYFFIFATIFLFLIWHFFFFIFVVAVFVILSVGYSVCFKTSAIQAIVPMNVFVAQ